MIFLPRCNFRCPYCHNHGLVLHPEQYATIPLKDILGRLHASREWIDGVCITGGEPTLHLDLPLLVREIKRRGFLVKLDTNGSTPSMLGDLVERREIDFVSMDVKAPLRRFSYSRAAGLAVNLALVLESIELLKRGNVEYEFRLTVVPGLHGEEDIRSLGNDLKAGKRFILQNFNPQDPLDPLLKNTLPYDRESLKEIEKEVQETMVFPANTPVPERCSP